MHPPALNRGSGFGDHILNNVGSFQMCLQVTFGLRLAPSPPLIEITRVTVFSSRFVSLIVFCSLAQISILATNGQVLREDWLCLVTWRTSANVGRLIFITNSPQYECEAYWTPQWKWLSLGLTSSFVVLACVCYFNLDKFSCRALVLHLLSCNLLLAICWTEDASLTWNRIESKTLRSDSIASPLWCLDADRWIGANKIIAKLWRRCVAGWFLEGLTTKPTGFDSQQKQNRY